jgi:hypothetical protein
MWRAPAPACLPRRGESVKNAPEIERQYRLELGCLIDAKAGGNLVTSKWQILTIASPGFVRPERGQTSIKAESAAQTYLVRDRRKCVKGANEAACLPACGRAAAVVAACLAADALPLRRQAGRRRKTGSVTEYVADRRSSPRPSLRSWPGGRSSCSEAGYNGIRRLRWVRPDGS